jgi:hypothetical protein
MQKRIDLEHLVSCLRRTLRGTFQSIWQASFFWLSALLLASCVATTLTPASQPAAPLPRPGHALVYDFVATPDEIRLRAARYQRTSSDGSIESCKTVHPSTTLRVNGEEIVWVSGFRFQVG